MHRFRLRSIVLVVLMAAGTLIGIDAKPAAAAITNVEYLVIPHEDDEFEVWSLVNNTPNTYKVIIMMTQGEQSGGCSTAAQGALDGRGPYWYQGPSSPVGQPNYLEKNPLAAFASHPWTGAWTANCKSGRIFGLANFLNEKALSDSSIPAGWASSTSYTVPGNTLAGLPPQREDNGVVSTSRQMTVFPASNGQGMVIFFDLGDGDLTKEEVAWAVVAVRINKALLGIPNVPELRSLAAFRHDGTIANCHTYQHNDHVAVHQAMFQYDIVDAVQYGRTCALDPDVTLSSSVPLTDYNNTIAMSGNNRIGPLQTHYGWLNATFFDPVNYTCNECIMARPQSFWGRFS